MYKGNALPCFLQEIYHVCKPLDIMAKIYAKKRTAAKSKGRYARKKTSSRVAKRGGTLVGTKLNAVVAREVQKVLNSGAQNERRKVTLELSPKTQRQIFVNGKGCINTCLRLPITAAIPAMAGAQFAPDVRRRQSNRIIVTGVSVRVSISASDETRVMILPYEPHQTVQKHLDMVPLLTLPNASHGYVPEGFETTLVEYGCLGLISKHGPLMTKKLGDDTSLDSVDGSPFDCRVATHAGKPIGAVMRKVFGGGGLRRTVNWDQAAREDVGAGYTAWTTHKISEHWKLNKVYTYSHEGMNDQVFERNAEMFMYIDCPSLVGRNVGGELIDEETEVVGAVVRNVIVDVYFHEL